MTKRKVTILIVLMAVALVGIMALQLIWMRNALQVRNELFDRSVDEALNRTTNRMERLSDVFMVHDIVAPPPPPPPMALNNARMYDRKMGFRPDHVPYRTDSIRRYEYEATTRNGKTRNHLKIHSANSKDSISQEINVEVVQADSLINNWEDQIEHQITIMYGKGDTTRSDRQPDLKKKIGRKVERLKNVAGQMVSETWAWDHANLSDTASVRSVLSEELRSRNIPIGYEFAIVGDRGIKIKTAGADSVKVTRSKYSTPLFPNAIFNNDEMLSIYFPERKAFILNTLLLPMVLSLLFCAVIMVTFGLSLYYILNQKKVSEMKSDFINNMTHEFKTPLATISVAADTITNSKIINDPEKITHFMGIIKKENQRLNQHVETILRTARLDKKEFEFQFSIVDTHSLIDKAIQGISLQIENREGSIRFEKGALNPMVTTDPAHALSMLNNLLDNANKYSQEEPEIEVKTRNSDRGVWISVSDKGIGMSKQVQHKIFEKFYRETTGNIHNVKGFGLGLSYVKAVIDANKGEVRVTSEPGKGSTFEVFLPFTLTS